MSSSAFTRGAMCFTKSNPGDKCLGREGVLAHARLGVDLVHTHDDRAADTYYLVLILFVLSVSIICMNERWQSMGSSRTSCWVYVHKRCHVCAEEGAVRLANSVIAADGSAEYGRLEVFHNGGWGTVCDTAFGNRFFRQSGFDADAAQVACRQLGYQEGFQIQKLVRPGRRACRNPLFAVQVISLKLCTSSVQGYRLCSPVVRQVCSVDGVTCRHSYRGVCGHAAPQGQQHDDLVQLCSAVLPCAVVPKVVCFVSRPHVPDVDPGLCNCIDHVHSLFDNFAVAAGFH